MIRSLSVRLIAASAMALLAIAVVARGLWPTADQGTSRAWWDYGGVLCAGFVTSLEVSAIAIVAGTALGFSLALLARSRRQGPTTWLLRTTSMVFVYAFLAIPAYTLILFSYYWHALASWSAFWIAATALAINLAPFAAQIFIAGLASIPQAQIETSRAFGYQGWRLYATFHVRHLSRSIGRPLLVQFYTTAKLSSLAAIIGVNELMHAGQIVIQATYETLIVYAVVSLGYVLLVTPIALLADSMGGTDDDR